MQSVDTAIEAVELIVEDSGTARNIISCRMGCSEDMLGDLMDTGTIFFLSANGLAMVAQACDYKLLLKPTRETDSSIIIKPVKDYPLA